MAWIFGAFVANRSYSSLLALHSARRSQLQSATRPSRSRVADADATSYSAPARLSRSIRRVCRQLLRSNSQNRRASDDVRRSPRFSPACSASRYSSHTAVQQQQCLQRQQRREAQTARQSRRVSPPGGSTSSPHRYNLYCTVLVHVLYINNLIL